MEAQIHAKIRRHQSILICSGLGVIAFGLWGIVKIIMMWYLDPTAFEELVGFASLTQEEQIYLTVIYAVIAVLVAADLLIRVYIGRSAVKEGSGQKKRIFYVIWTAVYLFASVGGDIDTLMELPTEHMVESVTATVIDLTSCFAMLQIIISSIALRRITARQKNKGE